MSPIDSDILRSLLSENRFHDISRSVEASDTLILEASPDVQNIYAVSLFKLGRYEELLPILENLDSYLHSDSNFLSLFGATYRRLGKYDKAVYYLELAIKLDPDNFDIKNNLANLNIDLKNYTRADFILNEILSHNPKHEDASINLKRLRLLQSSEIGEANSSTGNSEPFKVLDPLMLAFSEDEINRTFATYKATTNTKSLNLLKSTKIQNDNEIASELLSLAKKSVNEGLYDESLNLCTKALSSLGPLPDIYECASDAYLGLNKFHEAEVSLLIAYILGSRGSKLLLNLISFTSMRKDFPLSSHILQQIMITDPSCPHIPKFESMLNKHRASNDTNSFSFQEWILD